MDLLSPVWQQNESQSLWRNRSDKISALLSKMQKRVLGQCSKTEDGIKRRARYLKYRACFSPKKGDQQALFLFYVVSTQFRWHPLPGVRQ